MANPLPFAVQAKNPAVGGAAVLVQGVVNELRVDLRNRKAEPIQFSDESKAVILIGLAAYLPAELIANLEISALGFEAGFDGLIWTLRPVGAISVAAGATVAVTIKGLKLGTGITRLGVTLFVSWRGALLAPAGQAPVELPFDGRAVMLAVHAGDPALESTARPPLELSWLTEDAGPMALRASRGIVAITPSDAVPVRNRLAFRLQNMSGAPLVSGETRDRPRFVIHCLTVDDAAAPARYDALTTAAALKDVILRVQDDDAASWTADWFEDELQWVLTPTIPEVLYARESVVVVIENLVTILPEHPTALYLEYRDLPGYDSGTLELPMEKMAAWPTIGRFEASSGPMAITEGAPLTLSWQCWGVPAAYGDVVNLYAQTATTPRRLLAVNLPLVHEYAAAPTEEFTYYSISLPVPHGPVDAHARVQLGRAAMTFTASPTSTAPGDPVTLSYSYNYASSVLLRQTNGADISLPSGGPVSETRIVRPMRTTTYEFEVGGLGGPLKRSVRIDVPDALEGPDGEPKVDVFMVVGDQIYSTNSLSLTIRSQGALPNQEGPPEMLADFAIWHGIRTLFRNPPWEQYTCCYVTSGRWLYTVCGTALGPIAFNLDRTDVSVNPVVSVGPASPPSDRHIADRIFGMERVAFAQVRQAPDGRVLVLTSQRRLIWMNGEDLRGDVESMDVTQNGQIYCVDVRSRTLLWFTNGQWQTLCAVPADSTRIVASLADKVYWVENGAAGGPTLFCYTRNVGKQAIGTLPGRVPFFGIALDPSAIIRD